MSKRSPWISPKLHKPSNGVNVFTKSICNGVTYYHVAFYDATNDEWYSANDDDELMYSEYIVGWMDIPE